MSYNGFMWASFSKWFATLALSMHAIIPTPSTMPTPAPSHPFQWGAYAGWQVSQYQELADRMGKYPQLVGIFVHWGNENQLPQDLAAWTKAHQGTLVIYWEAMDYNISGPNDPDFSYSEIISGKYDSYISSFAKSLKYYGQPVILVPFEEANGDWYPWSISQNSNSPAKHIQAYRYLRKFFADIPNVKFAWSVNNDPLDSIDSYYPGDEYVDVVGVDGFNFGSPWQTYSQIFSPALNKLASYRKPIYIFSMACASGSQKSAWIAIAISQIKSDSRIIGFIWFNENKEKDWRIWSDSASLKSFQQALSTAR